MPSQLRASFIGLLLSLVLCLSLLGCDATGYAVPSTYVPNSAITPSPGKGIVVGLFLEYDPQTPLANTALFLSDIINDSPGAFAVASLDPVSAPRAYTNNQGEFVFKDVMPKDYVLATVSPKGYVFLLDPSTNQTIRVSVKAGEVVNLGKVFMDLSKFK